MSTRLRSFLEVLGENPFPCLFELLQVTYILTASSSIFKGSNIASLWNYFWSHISVSDHSREGVSPLKGMWDYTGPTWVIQGNFLNLKTLQHICKVLYDTKGNTFTGLGDQDMDMFERPLFLLPKIGISFECARVERKPLWLPWYDRVGDRPVLKVLQVIGWSLDLFLWTQWESNEEEIKQRTDRLSCTDFSNNLNGSWEINYSKAVMGVRISIGKHF